MIKIGARNVVLASAVALAAPRVAQTQTIRDTVGARRDSTAVAVRLPGITSRAEAQCGFRPDSALALGAWWEDARAALSAAAITRDRRTYRFSLVDYLRTYDLASRELRAVRTTNAQWSHDRSWVSLPPDRLRRDGYVTVENDSTSVVAPDIETFISPYFVETHCFRFAASPSDSLVAIEFTPVSGIRHAEVAGRLWLGRSSHELRSVDFHYTNVTTEDSLASGRVELARLATGDWVMTDWSLRAAARDQLRVYGGALRSVWRDSSLVWTPPAYALFVHVTRGAARAALAGDEAAVYLPGTGRAVALDSGGSARVDSLTPGAYLVSVGTRELDMLGWPRPQAEVDVGHRPLEVIEFNLADPLDAARVACGNDAKLLSPNSGVLIGSVLRAGAPQGGRDVTVVWPLAGEGATGALSEHRRVRTLSGDGRFLVCGVPRDRPLSVRVDGTTVVDSTRLAAAQAVGIITLSIAP